MLKIANRYGNVDVTAGKPPRGYVYIAGDRLQSLCRKLRIKFCPAVVGFDGKKKYGFRPVFGGVVVTVAAALKLCPAITQREKRVKHRYRVRQPYHYGGEEVTRGGKVYTRYALDALTVSEWTRLGFRVTQVDGEYVRAEQVTPTDGRCVRVRRRLIEWASRTFGANGFDLAGDANTLMVFADWLADRGHEEAATAIRAGCKVTTPTPSEAAPS